MIKRNPRVIKRHLEIWKPIEGFPNYEISNMGRVRSLERWAECNGGMRLIKERILKSPLAAGGYPVVVLCMENKPKMKRVHLLVILHFGDPKPTSNYECNHKDGDKQNSWNNNLEWMTRKENIQHAYDNDLCDANGENNGRALLSGKEVKQIRKLHKTGKYTQVKLSKKFNISGTMISFIINHKAWKYI